MGVAQRMKMCFQTWAGVRNTENNCNYSIYFFNLKCWNGCCRMWLQLSVSLTHNLRRLTSPNSSDGYTSRHSNLRPSREDGDKQRAPRDRESPPFRNYIIKISHTHTHNDKPISSHHPTSPSDCCRPPSAWAGSHSGAGGWRIPCPFIPF